MGLLGDFAAGAGAVGAQMSMEALRSTIEEERATRLAEMQQKFQVARDNADRGFRAGEAEKDRGWRTGEAAIDRTFRAGEAEKADTRATDRMYVGASIAEEAATNDFERNQPNKEREFAQRDRQIGISGGANSLARERFKWEKEQAELGKAPVVQNDGTIGYVKTNKDADGNMRRTFAPLLDGDGKPVRGPKNLSESNKIIYGAQAKIAGEGSNPEAAKEATAIMRAIEMNPSVDFGSIKLAEPGGAKAGLSKGDAKYAEMQREGAKAGPMNTPAPRSDGPDPAAALLSAGQALEARNPELKALGNQMRMMDGNAAASARAAYLQKVRDLQSGATTRKPIIPDLMGG